MAIHHFMVVGKRTPPQVNRSCRRTRFRLSYRLSGPDLGIREQQREGDQQNTMALRTVPAGSIRHREFAMASGEMSKPEFTGFLKASFGNLARHSRAANPYIWMDRTGLEMGQFDLAFHLNAQPIQMRLKKALGIRGMNLVASRGSASTHISFPSTSPCRESPVPRTSPPDLSASS
jgi:hypothetical protein